MNKDKNKSKTPLSDAFAKIRELGSGWDDVICVCRGLMKDNPCDLKCKEFFDEQLTNSHKEKGKPA